MQSTLNQNKSKLSKFLNRNTLAYLLVIVAYAILQTMISTGNIKSLLKGMLVPICAYVVMAISLNLTVGVLGELSLGHAGFMSVGAFTGSTAAIALQNVIPSTGIRLVIALIVGAVFAAVFGIIVGVPVLRLKGDYLAIVTLAFGEIIKSLINNLYVGVDSAGLHLSMLEDKTNLLEGGKLIISGPMGIGGMKKISTFTAGIVLVLITLFIVFHIVDSRTGRAVMAIRDNRIAAESIGINVPKYKLTVFAVSAALAGSAGALFAQNYSTIVANKFDFNTSILVLVFVVLGGLNNMLGSIIAAAALTILPEALRQFSEYRMLVYALVLILVMLAKNSPAFKAFFTGLKRKKNVAGDGEEPGEEGTRNV